jgi:hypothetical protein
MLNHEMDNPRSFNPFDSDVTRMLDAYNLLHFFSGHQTFGDKRVMAWLLYTLGYSFLLAGNIDVSLQILNILKDIDTNLSGLLTSNLNSIISG